MVFCPIMQAIGFTLFPFLVSLPNTVGYRNSSLLWSEISFEPINSFLLLEIKKRMKTSINFSCD